jgi:hypothetical protein
MRKTITYKDIPAQVGCHHRSARFFLDYIRDDIGVPKALPLLNAIVVKQATGLPGSSWLPEGTSTLSPKEYKEKYELYRDQVFACDQWDALLERLGLAPVRSTEDELDQEARLYDDYVRRTNTSGEGEPHRLLKEYVAQHPETIELPPTAPFATEYTFISGDRCDVVFDLGEEDGVAVVEIKNGDRGELVKGIYQAVKYWALMVAERGHGALYPVRVRLVAYDHIPEDIRALATKLSIWCYAVPRSLVASA